jgi:hypothetical protein
VGFELGSVVLLATGDNSADTEVLGRYAISAKYQTTSGFYVLTEILGIVSITEEGDFDERSYHNYAFGAGFNFKKFGLGVSYKNYFDDLLSYEVNGILDLHFTAFL